MISYYSVTKKFNKEVALRDVSFDVQKGEFVFLTGVSGSGKSTLLRMLCREVKPTEGSIYVFDKRINKMNPKKLRRKMGIVFQDYKLLENKTVLENVAYPLSCLGINPFKVKRKAIEALKKMQMVEFKNKKPEELSGGQQQRVAIARAIVTEPELLICDEPTGNLDMEHTWIIMKHLEELNEAGTTIIMTTHNEEIVKQLKKRVIHLHYGELIGDSATEETKEMPVEVEVEDPVIQKLNNHKNMSYNILEPNETVAEEQDLVSADVYISSNDVTTENKQVSKREREMAILRELGWTEEDELRFQQRYQNKKRKIEGGQ